MKKERENNENDRQDSLSHKSVEENIDTSFEEIEEREHNEIDENIGVIDMEYEESSIMNKFFKFDQYAFPPSEEIHNQELQIDDSEEEWSIEDIIFQI
ncbi:10811_t:CDS:2 [Racocetra fulgida]|uniref:10811_t:CDS:1 n=1 Tax=Racocetra fulgida TaxID=60492 RepID=A0A9N9F3P9_9GLOM|nr:10811_t:CDS:2 [Racocetra fulgida]